MKRLLSLLLVVATTMSASACGDSTGPSSSLTGTYTLSTLGGQQPPAQLFYNSASDNVVILNSQITLYADGTYTDNTRVQDTQYGTTTVSNQVTSGTWLLSGSQLTLQENNSVGYPTYATASGNEIRIDNFSGYSQTAIYRR